MPSVNQDKELRIKDVILFIQSYFKAIIPKWKFILIVAFLLGFLGLLKTKMQGPLYNERLTFMMDESKKKGGFNPADILGGILGGTSGKSGDNLGKILQLFESKKIIHNTLFDTITINNKSDYLANHYLNIYTIQTLVESYKYPFVPVYKIGWPKKLLKNEEFRFTHNDVDNFNRTENQYLRLLYERINGNPSIGITPALSSTLNEETGIMALKMSSEFEPLTLGVLNNIYKQLSGFFIEKSVEKQRKTYDIMEFKRDSIFEALKSSEYQLADFKDSNRKLVTVKGYLQEMRLERQARILNLMYAEVIKNLEATDFALRNMTPVVQIIDLPRSPIVPFLPSWRRAFFMFAIIGAILAILYIWLRMLYRQIMED